MEDSIKDAESIVSVVNMSSTVGNFRQVSGAEGDYSHSLTQGLHFEKSEHRRIFNQNKTMKGF